MSLTFKKIQDSSTLNSKLQALASKKNGENKKTDKNSSLSTKPSEDKFKDTNLNISPDIFVSLKTGHINDYYKIGKTIGEGNRVCLFSSNLGAYGKVYQVVHRKTGIIRAMKSLKKSVVIKEEEEKLFAEVSILKELDHPNIVKLYELYQDDSHYYMITEYFILIIFRNFKVLLRRRIV